MACDLERIFGALADQVPEHDDQDDEAEEAGETDIIFYAENLPRPPAEMRTDKIAMRWGYHDYGSTPFETVEFCTDKRTLRLLGLLILSKVFHDGPEHVVLHVGMPAIKTGGVIPRLVLDYDRESSHYYGYVTKPDRFRYTSGRPEKHPWYDSPLQPMDMPILHLAGSDWEMGRLNNAKLETAVGFGTDEGHVNFAELLLDASMPWNERDEYVLEGECGFRGVGPGSAEIQIYLPGHLFHDDPVPRP